MVEKLAGWLDQLSGLPLFLLTAFVGGAVDYANQLSAGTKTWRAVGFVVHVATACFFGWLFAKVTTGFGYDTNLVGAAAGMGGFLGTRAFDLLMTAFNRVLSTPKN